VAATLALAAGWQIKYRASLAVPATQQPPAGLATLRRFAKLPASLGARPQLARLGWLRLARGGPGSQRPRMLPATGYAGACGEGGGGGGRGGRGGGGGGGGLNGGRCTQAT
jgi:hypothetical protein